MLAFRTRLRAGPVTWQALAGGLASLVVAVALYSRFSIHILMTRDEGIYTYSGQQMAHGVAPYASIFDPKGPMAGVVAGLAAMVARGLGQDDIYAIRLAFFGCAVLAVLAVYLLVTRLFRSALGGLTAAVVFAANWPFAVDALAGPNAKTPAVLFAVLSMWLLTRRKWFWGAVLACLTVLVWQPMVIYVLVALALPPLVAGGQRLRAFLQAVAGVAVPVVAVSVYFALAGAFDDFVAATLLFPLLGVRRSAETVGARLLHIRDTIDRYYGFGGLLFWVGLALLLVCVVVCVAVPLLRGRSSWRAALLSPLVAVVLVTLLGNAAYAVTDFQSYHDLYPFLPYPAIGIGGAVALLVARLRARAVRRVGAVAVLAALVLLTGLSWVSFGNDPVNTHRPGLRAQLADGCALDRLRAPGTPLLSLGDPVPLVTTHSRNPDRFIYLGSGVDHWKVDHTPGGFAGWRAQIRRWSPSVIVLRSWGGPYRPRMVRWLQQSGYLRRYVGVWAVFVTPDTVGRARQQGVVMTLRATKVVRGPGGSRLPVRNCG